MKDFCETEKTSLQKWSNFQLPHRYKKIGWAVVILTLILMLGKKFVDEPEWVKPVLRNVMLLGLLMVSIAKEKIEDEFMVSLRAMSYRLAFIFGVIYTVVQPYIDYAVGYLIEGKGEFERGSFQVIIFMLLIQVMFFYVLKKSTK